MTDRHNPIHLSLEGGCNFRDLGGYKTSDGHCLRSGILFRSGVLSYLTDSDKTNIAALNIRTIVDLRKAGEREREPTRWPDAATAILVPDSTVAPGETGNSQPDKHKQTAEDVKVFMLNFYRAMEQTMVPHLRILLDAILARRTPLLFHCASGKDRTGLAAALLLHAVGVPRSTILEDYSLTNTTVDLETFIRRFRQPRLNHFNKIHPGLALAPDARAPMLRADPVYLETALTRIEESAGSLDRFLEEKAGLTPEKRDSLRSHLLTAPDFS
jgi:protein-tyrosine phosphatase